MSETAKARGMNQPFIPSDIFTHRPSRGSQTCPNHGAVSNRALQGSQFSFANTSPRKMTENRTSTRLFQGPSRNDAPSSALFPPDALDSALFRFNTPTSAPKDARSSDHNPLPRVFLLA